MLYTFYKVVVMVNKIRELREARGMRQEDLAQLLNVTRVSVSRYETGSHGLDAPTICRLCEIFGCTADYLLGRSSRPAPALTEAEAQLLAAYAAATPEIRAIVDHALAPYREEKEADRLA